MKQYITLFLLQVFPVLVFAQQTEKDTDPSWSVHGVALITNNGFAPIPAFSFERPTVMVFLLFENLALRMTYRYNYAADPQTVTGHLIDLYSQSNQFNNHIIF